MAPFDLSLDMLRTDNPGIPEPDDTDAFWARTLVEACAVDRTPAWKPVDAGLAPCCELTPYFAVHQDHIELALRTLAYGDGCNVARRASARIMDTVGLRDKICPPSTMFASDNRDAGENEMTADYDNGHDMGGSMGRHTTEASLRQHLGEGQAKDDTRRRKLVRTEMLTWTDFGIATVDLARKIRDDGYQPDMILAIARGGVFTAGAVGYALGVKLLHVVNVEFYTGREERLTMPVMLPPVPDASMFAGARVLICDDVADTGATIALTREFVSQHVAEVRSAVIYQKPRASVDCEYVWKETADWIHFPWDEAID